MARRPSARNNGKQAPERTTLRVVGYVRCSDEGQSVSDYNTLDNQKNFISNHVVHVLSATRPEPYELTRFYVDDGFSGKDTDRPALTELLADVQAGKVDVIVVYKLDRITRSLSDFFQLDKLFQEQGVSLVSVKEQLDTSTPMHRAMRNLLMVFAELERETIAERTRDKMYAEVRQGRWTGGNVPVGYMVQDKKLVPNPAEAPVIPIIYDKYVETRSSARIRDFLNTSGYRTAVRPCKSGTRGGGDYSIQLIDQILRNPLYKGTRVYGSLEIPKCHPALITPEMFELVQNLLPDHSRRSAAKVEHTYILQGLVYCPHCGMRMTPWYVLHNDNRRRPRNYTAYYECQRGHKNPLQKSCPVKRVNAHRLEAALLKDISELETSREAMASALSMLKTFDGDDAALRRLEDVRTAQRQTEGRIEKLVAALETGAALVSVEKRLKELEQQVREYRAEAMLLEAELAQARQEIPTVEAAQAWFREIRRTMEDASEDERKEFVSLIVHRVELTDKKEVQVDYYVPPALAPDELACLNLEQGWLPGVDSNHEPSG